MVAGRLRVTWSARRLGTVTTAPTSPLRWATSRLFAPVRSGVGGLCHHSFFAAAAFLAASFSAAGLASFFFFGGSFFAAASRRWWGQPYLMFLTP